MGIHKEIREKLLEKSVAHAAFLSKRADAAQYFSQRAAEWKTAGLAFVEDSLTRMNALMGPLKDYTFNGRELLNAFVREISETFARFPATVFVSVFDDQDNVPAEKRETQAKRAIRSKHEPYPHGSMIQDEGIAVPGAQNVERLDLRRIMRSRHLRKSVWSYFRDNLCSTWIGRGRLANGTRVLFEYEKEGPYIYTADLYKTLQLEASEPEKAFAHDHGEADRSVFYWVCTQFRRKHCVIRTIDTDVIPIAFLQIPTRLRDAEDHGDILWQDRDQFVDLRLLRRSTLASLALTDVAFAFWCCVCGTDFVKKEWLSFGIGTEALLDATQKHGIDIDTLWRDPTSAFASKVDLVTRFLATLYFECDPKTRRVMDALSGADKRKTIATKLDKRQRTLFAKPTVPAWDDIYKALAVAVDNAARAKKNAAKAAKSKGKKRKADENDAESTGKDEAQEPKPRAMKEITTNLRPPDAAMIQHATTRIDFNLRYWMNVPGVQSH